MIDSADNSNVPGPEDYQRISEVHKRVAAESFMNTDIPGPEDYGAKLFINKPFQYDPRLPVSLDVETDENGHFVGAGLCWDENEVYYYSDFNLFKQGVSKMFKFIMQGGKFDIRELKSWGIDVDYDMLAYDTKIMAYTYNSTLPSYSLKKIEKGKRVGLIETFLPHLKWPTYKEMVGVGKKKVTLDKQPERTPKYCGMDALSTFKLKQCLWSRMSEKQKQYFLEIEMPIYRLLARMEDKGIMIDKQHLSKVGKDLMIKQLEMEKCFEMLGFNPRSPKQILSHLKNKEKLNITKTDISTLKQYADLPIVRNLINYRKYKKIHSTYIAPYLEMEGDRVHTNFTQSTITGRLASSKPNLQNIPAPDPELKRFPIDTGTMIRRAFIAPEGKNLVCLDYSQIELRLLAHFSQEPVLLKTFKEGQDIHQATASAIGIPDNRRLGKTINFCVVYGGQAKKIAELAGVSLEDAEKAYEAYWKKLPKASSWITMEKFKARKYGGVTTLMGRFIPLPLIRSKDKWERLHWERVAINAIIQGSAAEVIKKAMLSVYDHGYLPLISCHDEMVFEMEGDDDYLKNQGETIKYLMETVVELSVPLETSVGIGRSWAHAK